MWGMTGHRSGPWPGPDLPPGTPVANLWNVGDGVKEYANGGITACAETAQIVAGQVAERYPPG
jgi:phytoene desaturase